VAAAPASLPAATGSTCGLSGLQEQLEGLQMTISPSAFDQELEDRLVRYARIDTTADEASTTRPSTAIQLDLQRLLMAELEEIGAQEIALTSYGALLATIPATVEHDVPVIAFLAHVDTSPKLRWWRDRAAR
jgi:hypothetical protein